MANTARGEVSIEHDGQTYVLVFDIEAMCQVEDLSKQTIGELVDGVMRGGIRPLRFIFWAGLRRHHGSMSIEDVGAWMSAVGLSELMAKFTELAKTMRPDAEDAKTLKMRPRKAQASA